MNFIKLVILLTIISTNLTHAQDWLFEYQSPYNNFVHKSWQSKNNSNTIHGITLETVPQSGKDRRSRLIELNENGDLVSFFKPTQCNTLAFYHPYGQDSIISVSRKCDGEWINTFNIFNANGQKIFTKEFENKFIKNQIIAHHNGVTLLRTGNQHNGNIELSELSQKGQKEYTFPFSDFKEEGYSISANHCIRLETGKYLMGLSIYQPYKKFKSNDSYPKLLLINKDKIEWQIDYKSKLKKIRKLLEIDSGYLIQGTDRENRHTIIKLDKKGDHVNTFHPESPHRSIQVGIYVSKDQLFTVSNKIHGSTIFVSQYDLSSGEMTKQISSETEFWRMSTLQIAAVRPDHFIITGRSVRSSETKQQRAFVMRIMRDNTTLPEDLSEQDILIDFEELIEETSEDILSVKVFPNPATFTITFELEGQSPNDKMILRIFDVNGSLVNSQEFSGYHLETDISSFPRGSYLYTVSSKEKKNIVSGKFIAQ